MKNFLNKFKWFIAGGFSVILLSAVLAYAAVQIRPSGLNNLTGIKKGQLVAGSSSADTLYAVPTSSQGSVLAMQGTGLPGFQATSTLGLVGSSRLVSAGTGLTGGGDLTVDRTISLSVPVSVSNGGTGTATLASLTVGTNLSITGGQNVLIGTSTQISLGGNVVTSVATGTAGNIFNSSISSNTLTLNLPIASASNTGQLQGSDFTIFNNKVSTTRQISAGTGLTGGGDFSADRTISLSVPVVATNGGTGTTTAPTQTGQFLAADGTGSKYAPTTFINGSNIIITTSTAGSLTIAVTGLQPAGTYVTAVTGTSPITSSGGTTPAIGVNTGDLTLTSSNLTFGSGDGKKVLLGTTTNITLAASPSFTNGTFSGTLSVSATSTLATSSIPALSNLLTNGFVKTSGSNGFLSIDTNTYLTGNQTITLTGDVTGSGATSIATTYNNVVGVAKGGTGTSTAPTQAGQFLAADGTGVKYAPTTFINGTGILITTSTPGSLTIAYTNTANYITLASLSGTSPITYNNSTGAIGITLPLTAAQGGTGTTTAPTQQGQLLGADGTGVKYQPITLVNTATHSWATSTVGQLGANVLKVPNALTFNNGGSGASSGQTFDGSAAATISYNTIGAQATLTNPDTGTGVSGQAAYWSGSTALSGSSNFLWDNVAKSLLINTSTPAGAAFEVVASSSNASLPVFLVASTSGASLFQVTWGGNTNIATLTASSIVGTDANKNLNSVALPLSVTNGGHGAAPGADDQVFVADSVSAGTWRALPNCTDAAGNHLNYTTSTNLFSCGTSSSGGAGGGTWTLFNGGQYTSTTTDAVLIGTTTPTSADLYVVGTGTKNALVVASSSALSEFTIASNGNISFNLLGTGILHSSSVGLISSSAVDLGTADASGTLAAGRFPALTGDITTSAGSLGTTLATVNSSTSSCGDATHVCQMTANGKGLTTVNSAVSITGLLSGLTNGRIPYATSGTALADANVLFYNGSVVGMNATSTTIGFNIQGTGGTNNIFNVASSSGSSIMMVTNLSRVGVGTTTPVATFSVSGTSTAATLAMFDVASSTGVSVLQVTAGSQVLIGTTARLTIPQGTAPTLSAAGDIAQDTTNDQLLYGSTPNVLTATSSKTMTILSPTATEDDDFFITEVPIHIVKVQCSVRNSNTSSVTFSLPFNTDRSSAANNIFSSGQVCTGTTTPQSLTPNTTAIPANSIIWATTSATTLASTTSITIWYKYDRQ